MYAPFKVEEGKIREFAHALGMENSVFFRREAALAKGYPEIIAPPTFVTVIEMWNEHSYFEFLTFLNLSLENVLHGEQSYQYLNHIYAEDVIDSEAVIKKVITKTDKTFYYIQTKYVNQFDKTVVIGNTTLIDRKGKI